MTQSINVLKQTQQTVSMLLIITLLFKSLIEIFVYIMGKQNLTVWHLTVLTNLAFLSQNKWSSYVVAILFFSVDRC